MLATIAPAHEEQRSGWFGSVHMYAPACVITPAWATHERLGCGRRKTLIADCCLCQMPAYQTLTRVHLPLRVYWWDEAEAREHAWDNYYEPRVEIICGPGYGCNVKPRRRSSRHLREGWYECR